MMKKISFLMGVFFVFSTLVAYAQVLPDVKVENTRGEIISTKTLVDGKPFILSFWGVTCKPCITELNTLNELLEEWREEVDFNIVLYLLMIAVLRLVPGLWPKGLGGILSVCSIRTRT